MLCILEARARKKTQNWKDSQWYLKLEQEENWKDSHWYLKLEQEENWKDSHCIVHFNDMFWNILATVTFIVLQLLS